jgi:hypothetical protein
MRPIVFTLLIMVSVTKLSHGQWMDDSYVVLMNKDTLAGFVKYRERAKVFVKKSSQDKPIKLTPKDVEFFKVGYDYYYTVEYTDLNSDTMYSKAFMLLKVNGFIKLLEHKITSKMLYGSYGAAVPNVSYAYYIGVGEDKQFIPLSGGRLEDKLSKYISDNSELALRVKNKEYKRNDVEAVIIEYNKWKQNNKQP